MNDKNVIPHHDGEKGMVEDVAIAIKKYKIENGDIICMQLPVNIDEQTMIRFHKVITDVIKDTGKKASVIIMTDPSELYRLKPTDMAIMGWFPFDEKIVDRLNKSGGITYQERLCFMMMIKRLKSMLPINPMDLLNRHMKEKDNGKQ